MREVKARGRFSLAALAKGLGVPKSTVQGYCAPVGGKRAGRPPEDLVARAERLLTPAQAKALVPADQIEEPRLLCFGVDAFVLRFNAEVSGRIRSKIALLVADEEDKLRKKAASREDREVSVELGGVEWRVVKGNGRNHEAILKNEHATLALGRKEQKAPQITFTFASQTLWNLGVAGCWHMGEGIALAVHEESGGVAGLEATVSRIDLTADMLNVPLDHDERDGPVFVCAANMAEHDRVKLEEESGETMRTYRRRSLYCTGWSWGKGAHVQRIYRKLEEITKVSGKGWFLDVWAQQAGVEIDLKRDRDRVWRCEAQLRREKLARFVAQLQAEGKAERGATDPKTRIEGLDNLEALEAAIPHLWSYCVGTATSSGWLSWRSKDGEDFAKRSEWEHRPEWRLVQRAPEVFGFKLDGCALKIDRSRKGRAEQLMAGALGYIESMAAELDYEVHEGDLDKTLEWFREEAMKRLAEKETSFSLEVQRKARLRNVDLADAIKTNRALVKARARQQGEQEKVAKAIRAEVESELAERIES
jgi:hypothetical protein